MATILEGLNKLSGALGGAETATENLEALNAIAGALGGETNATNNADAIDQIAEHASGGGGGETETVKVTVASAITNTKVSYIMSQDGGPLCPITQNAPSGVELFIVKGTLATLSSGVKWVVVSGADLQVVSNNELLVGGEGRVNIVSI